MCNHLPDVKIQDMLELLIDNWITAMHMNELGFPDRKNKNVTVAL